MSKTARYLFFLILLMAACRGSVETPAPAETATQTAEPLPSPTETAVPTVASMPDLILVYTMDGGIAGFCERLEIYKSGEAAASSCKDSQVSTIFLSEAQHQQLLDWAGTQQPFFYSREDDAVADKMVVAVHLHGIGSEEASEDVRQAVFEMAEAVWGQTRQEPAAPTPTPADGGPPEEILILSPGPGSRVKSPLVLQGMSGPTFEQNLVVQLLLADGRELALLPTTIQAPIGEGGPFELEIPFEISGDQQGFLLVYATSARDGGVTHLSSTGITLSENGPQDIRPAPSLAERISIYSPGLNETISGGMVRVNGFALASFEQTLIVEVLDENGVVIGSQPIIVQAPDLGQPGPFSASVPYTLGRPGPGRIVVRDPSVVYLGDVHVASIEVFLEP